MVIPAHAQKSFQEEPVHSLAVIVDCAPQSKNREIEISGLQRGFQKTVANSYY
jgi:hypothetical protein